MAGPARPSYRMVLHSYAFNHLPQWKAEDLEKRLRPEQWQAPASWFYANVADGLPHNLSVFVARHFGLTGRKRTDIPDMLRNAKVGAWVRIPVPDAWHHFSETNQLISSKDPPPFRLTEKYYGAQTMYKGKGTVKQSRPITAPACAQR